MNSQFSPKKSYVGYHALAKKKMRSYNTGGRKFSKWYFFLREKNREDFVSSILLGLVKFSS